MWEKGGIFYGLRRSIQGTYHVYFQRFLQSCDTLCRKNADYGAAGQYLTFVHDEFTMKPTLDGNGQMIPRTGDLISSFR